MASPPSTGAVPSAFFPSTGAVTGNVVATNKSGWYDGLDMCEKKADDFFERLAVPPCLLENLIPRPNAFLSGDFCPKICYSNAQSFSKTSKQALGEEVVHLFSDLLLEISGNLPSEGCSSIKGLQVLANSLDVRIFTRTLARYIFTWLFLLC